jgi:hypothetical protein
MAPNKQQGSGRFMISASFVLMLRLRGGGFSQSTFMRFVDSAWNAAGGVFKKSLALVTQDSELVANAVTIVKCKKAIAASYMQQLLRKKVKLASSTVAVGKADSSAAIDTGDATYVAIDFEAQEHHHQ